MKTRWNTYYARWEKIEYYPSKFTGRCLIKVIGYSYPTLAINAPK